MMAAINMAGCLGCKRFCALCHWITLYQSLFSADKLTTLWCISDNIHVSWKWCTGKWEGEAGGVGRELCPFCCFPLARSCALGKPQRVLWSGPSLSESDKLHTPNSSRPPVNFSAGKLVCGWLWAWGCQMQKQLHFLQELRALKMRVNTGSWCWAWKVLTHSVCPTEGFCLPYLRKHFRKWRLLW